MPILGIPEELIERPYAEVKLFFSFYGERAYGKKPKDKRGRFGYRSACYRPMGNNRLFSSIGTAYLFFK